MDTLHKFSEHFIYKSNRSVLGAGKLVQRLRSLDFIVEDLGLIFSTHFSRFTHTCNFSTRESDAIFRLLEHNTRMHLPDTDTYA